MPGPSVVLIVDDEPLIRMDVSDQLQNLGLKVLEASNAREAVNMLAANAGIRALVTDVDMPGGMDGLQLAAAVRDGWPPIKIIVISGHRKVTMTEIPAESRFFEKPYRSEDIASAIRELMAA